MTGWRRTALGTLAALAVLVAAGALALHKLADPQRLREEARSRARQAWSRELDLASVSFALFPRPTFYARDLRIANPPWAAERELVHADRATARVSFFPLLMGSIRLEEVDLDGVRASLEVAPNGAKSWEIHPGAQPVPQAAALTSWLRIVEVVVTNADVRYRPAQGAMQEWRLENAAAGMRPGMRDVRFDARLASDGHPLHASGTFADLSRMGVAGASSQGAIDLDWGGTKVTVEGEFSLDHGQERGHAALKLESGSLEDLLGFFGLRARHTAPVRLSTELVKSTDRLVASHLDLTLGGQRVTGEVAFDLTAHPRAFEARLSGDDLDWGQALVDMGNPRPQPPPPGEIFPTRPLPWPLLEAMAGRTGAADLRFARLLLPDGIELREASAHLAIAGDHLVVKPFTAKLLGGSGSAEFVFDAPARRMQATLEGHDVLLERWFHERRRPVRFTGGPMRVRADVSGSGGTMKEVMGSITGPVSIVMGPGVYDSQAAGDWEQRMVRFSKAGSSGRIDFQCAAAALAFVSGRAKGRDIVAARSPLSRLVTSGDIDFKTESVDLHGAVRPAPDAGVGLAALMDDIEIKGPIRKMRVHLDPASTPKVVAKVGAAIATAGLSVAATATANRHDPDPDPCRSIFGPGHPAPS
jgi:uncharacterized protein involved in outer membrane biogenesis